MLSTTAGGVRISIQTLEQLMLRLLSINLMISDLLGQSDVDQPI